MPKIECFEDIQSWIMARELNQKIWEIVESTDLSKDYALRNQITRSAGSIMDNIAEGYGRNGNKEFCQFLSIAKSSCYETMSQLYRCFDRVYLSEIDFSNFKAQLMTIGAKIQAFINYLKSSDLKGPKFKLSS
jgi:four helix bundle protein